MRHHLLHILMVLLLYSCCKRLKNEIAKSITFYEGLFRRLTHFYEGLFELSIHFYEGLSTFSSFAVSFCVLYVKKLSPLGWLN